MIMLLCCTLKDAEVKRLDANAGSNSKLSKPVQDLIRMIFDVDSMQKAMLEFEVRPSYDRYQYSV